MAGAKSVTAKSAVSAKSQTQNLKSIINPNSTLSNKSVLANSAVIESRQDVKLTMSDLSSSSSHTNPLNLNLSKGISSVQTCTVSNIRTAHQRLLKNINQYE